MCKVTSFPDNTQQNSRFFLEKGETFFVTPHFHLSLEKVDSIQKPQDSLSLPY